MAIKKDTPEKAKDKEASVSETDKSLEEDSEAGIRKKGRSQMEKALHPDEASLENRKKELIAKVSAQPDIINEIIKKVLQEKGVFDQVFLLWTLSVVMKVKEEEILSNFPEQVQEEFKLRDAEQTYTKGVELWKSELFGEDSHLFDDEEIKALLQDLSV